MTVQLRPNISLADSLIEDRCAPRYRMEIPATLRPSGAQGFSVVVRDLSLAGFACEAVTTMPRGTRCWLTLPGFGGLQAEVAWNDGITVGCAFSNLLSQTVLDYILERWSAYRPG